MTKYIDLDALDKYLIEASNHYEKTAPTVEAYLDDLTERIIDQPRAVSLWEIERVSVLCEEGEWFMPASAINYCLHTMNTLGMDTSGIME